jgi:hypothetical protein
MYMGDSVRDRRYARSCTASRRCYPSCRRLARRRWCRRYQPLGCSWLRPWSRTMTGRPKTIACGTTTQIHGSPIHVSPEPRDVLHISVAADKYPVVHSIRHGHSFCVRHFSTEDGQADSAADDTGSWPTSRFALEREGRRSATEGVRTAVRCTSIAMTEV